MKKLSRRKFLILWGRTVCIGVLAWVLPFSFRSKADLRKAKKKFAITVKAFQRDVLYKKHNLAG